MLEPEDSVRPEPAPDDKAEKSAKRLRKLQRSGDTRTLAPWERYRTLTDVLEDYNDMAETADRKTRFALIIMGALNAGNVLAVARPDVIFGSVRGGRPWLGAYIAVYALLSLFSFVQAILALKPRSSSILGRVEAAGASLAGLPGLRFAGHVVAQSADEYYRRWAETQIGHLNREIAMHVQLRARVNLAKYKALERVYTGLLILVVLTAALVTALVYGGFQH